MEMGDVSMRPAEEQAWNNFLIFRITALGIGTNGTKAGGTVTSYGNEVRVFSGQTVRGSSFIALVDHRQVSGIWIFRNYPSLW